MLHEALLLTFSPTLHPPVVCVRAQLREEMGQKLQALVFAPLATWAANYSDACVSSPHCRRPLSWPPKHALAGPFFAPQNGKPKT